MTALDDALAAVSAAGGYGAATSGGGDYSFLDDLPGDTKKKKGLFGGNLLEDVFAVAALPLHASYAVAEETVGQAARAAGNAVYGAPQDAGFSLSRIGRRTIDPASQLSGADLIAGNPEKGLDVGMFGKQGVYSHAEPPALAKVIGGLGLDVAFDPLTFLAPGAGSAEAAGHIAETAGAQIGKELLPETGGKLTKELINEILTKTKPIDSIVKVSPETALRVEEIRNAAQDAVYAARRGGASNLTAEQLGRFGTHTNELGITKTLEKGLNLDFGRLGKVRLTHGESPLAQVSIIKHKAQMQLGDLLLGGAGEARGLGKLRLGRLNGAPELSALARSGAARRTAEAPLSMMDATVIKRLRSTTRNISENAAKEAQRVTNEAVKGFSTEEINAAHDVIDSGAAAADARVNELARKLSDAFEKHGKQLVDAGVLSEADLMKSGSYFPSPITKDSREALVAAGLHPAQEGGVFNNVKGFVEGRRKLWDPTTGKGGVGVDSETTQRIPFMAKTRAEAEQKASKILAEQLKKASEVEGEAGDAARQFLGEHPEAMKMLEAGEYPLFLQGREALVAQTRAIGRRVAQSRAGQKLFEQGYGLIDPRHAAGFVDYGPSADEVSRMLRLGGQASETAIDRNAAAREMRLTANEMARDAKARFGTSPQTPLEGVLSPSPPVAPEGATPFGLGSDAAHEARLAADPAAAGNAVAAAPAETPLQAAIREAMGAPPEAPPTIAPGEATVPMYRGESPGGATNAGEAGDIGSWYTDSREAAKLWAGDKGTIHEVAVPKSVADASKVGNIQYNDAGALAGQYQLPHEWRATPKTGGGEQALHAVQQELTHAAVMSNMHAVEATMDDVRSYLHGWEKSARGKTVLGMTEHENQLRSFIKDLQLKEPSSFGYRDPLEEAQIPGFKPTGGAAKLGSPQERINAMERMLKDEVKNYEAHPDVYAAKTRARVEGKLAEDAQKAKAGLALDPTTPVAERPRPWTYEEKQAHKTAYETVKRLGAERGAAIQEVKAAEVAAAKAAKQPTRLVRQTTERADTRLRLAQDERAQLAQGLEQKQAMDLQDAADAAARAANEAPVGTSSSFESDTLQQWAERNAMPIEHGPVADYARERAQGVGTSAESKRLNLTTDRAVTDQVEQRIKALDDEISFLQRTAASNPARPVTQHDLAVGRLEAAKARLADLNATLETAKRAQRPVGSTATHDVASGRTVQEVTPGSAYDQALTDFHAQIAAANARAVEPHLEGREAWVPGDAPFRDIETGLTIKEGTLQGAVHGVNAKVIAERVKVIEKRWKALAETAGDHSRLRDAFAAYKGKLDKAIPQSVGRDMNALAHTQVDQVGRLAQNEAHVASTVDDLVADAEAVKGVATSVIPEQVQVNVEKRAVDGAAWKQMSDQARRDGEAAKAEIAHMRLVADTLANDADLYRADAAYDLHPWNAITTERKMHSAVNSLLVQGQIDWLAHTSLQRGILTPQGVADALQYTERLATPEHQNRLAESWRKALHWMRVWQITSPGFHVRNMFGGVFNNALAGVNVESYVRFRMLWRKALKGKTLTAEEASMWRHITSVISPGQISSEGLGNPASRLLGESAISKTPWGQLGTHGVLPRVSEAAGANVEFYLRGTLIYDTMNKGGSLDSAVEAVNRFHFDYHDASATEQKLKANLIPFLTWTRHNVPLQLQMMLENPRPYARFAHFKNEMEGQSSADKVTPGYFADINAVRLPWQQGGGHNYYIPDLPFRDVGLVTEPIQQLTSGEGDLGQRMLGALGEPISQTTPLVSGPVEWMLGKQFFKGLPLRGDRGIKLHDLHIPEWLAAPLRLTPLVKRGANGQSYITEKDFYIIEKMIPILGRTRRLGGSSETKQQTKFMSHMISFFAGTQIRTNTLDDQKIANFLSTLETKRLKTINNGLSK